MGLIPDRSPGHGAGHGLAVMSADIFCVQNCGPVPGLVPDWADWPEGDPT